MKWLALHLEQHLCGIPRVKGIERLFGLVQSKPARHHRLRRHLLVLHPAHGPLVPLRGHRHIAPDLQPAPHEVQGTDRRLGIEPEEHHPAVGRRQVDRQARRRGVVRRLDNDVASRAHLSVPSPF